LPSNQIFIESDRVTNILNGKQGKIRRLRNDKQEQGNWQRSDASGQPREYNYYVDYDDGTFNTYESSSFLKATRKQRL